MIKIAAIVGLALAFTLRAGTVYASPISLTFTTLPSAQGWTFQAGGGETESSVFSVNGTGLTLNDMGDGSLEPDYLLPGAVNDTQPFVFSETAAVFSEEGTLSTPLSFFFEVRTASPNEEAVIGITPTDVFETPLNGGASLALNGTAFNTYALTGMPDGDFSLYVNGLLAFSGVFATQGNPLDGVQFGDNGATGLNGSFLNADAEITCLSYLQGDGVGVANAGCTQASSAVPEPATLTLTAFGLSGLVARYRRRRSRSTP